MAATTAVRTTNATNTSVIAIKMSDVERARNATKATTNTASTTETGKATTKTTTIERNTTNSEQLQYRHTSTAPTTTTPGAAAAAAVKLQHQQLYHNQLYHQQQQQQQNYSKPTTHYNYNNGATVAQQQPQYQLIASAGGEFGSAANVTSIFGSCFGLLLKVVFSPPGLVALVVGYSMLGACIFPLLEAPQDINTSAAIAKSREECLRELWIITGEWNQKYLHPV